METKRKSAIKQNEMLETILNIIIQNAQPDKIILFGSMARGENTEDSDYDFLVVVDEPRQEMSELEDIGYQSLYGLGVAKDVVVWTVSQFQRKAHLNASLPGTVLQEGKLLYAA